MRVVHLIDSGKWTPEGPTRPPDLELCACRLLQEHAPVEQKLVLLGPAAAAKRAARLGITPDVAIAPPLCRPELAWPVLRRMALRPDIVHCWSPSSARLAALASGGRIVTGCRTLSPPVSAAPVNSAGRQEARARLGIPDKVPALVLLGRGHAADAQRFLYILGGLQYAGVSVIGVVPAWARQVRRALRFAHRFRAHIRFVVRDEPWSEVLPAADLAIWDSPEREDDGVPESWFIAQAHAMGVPVVAARSGAIEPLYPAGAADRCLAANATPPELARIAMPLLEDPALREGLSADVRQHVRGAGHPSKLVEQAMYLWQSAPPAPPRSAAMALGARLFEWNPSRGVRQSAQELKGV